MSNSRSESTSGGAGGYFESIMTFWQGLQAKRQAFLYYAGDRSPLGALLRWAVWAIRCLLRLAAIADIPRFGMRLYLVPRWIGCWKAIFVFRERFFEVADPELEFTRRSLKPGYVFIDAGAYHGWYSLVASTVVGDSGLVLAFEPNPDAYAILTRNLMLNARRNIQIFNFALSDSEGSVTLYRGPDDEVASSLSRVPGWKGEEQVMARRLTDVLEELDVRRVDVMKVDVEGAEASVLRGALGTLQESNPLVVFEVNPAAAKNMGVSERSAWDLLGGLGYRFFELSAATLVPLCEFPTIPVGAVRNVIAIHRSSERARMTSGLAPWS